jgi:HEPN domain-containing protein
MSNYLTIISKRIAKAEMAFADKKYAEAIAFAHQACELAYRHAPKYLQEVNNFCGDIQMSINDERFA